MTIWGRKIKVKKGEMNIGHPHKLEDRKCGGCLKNQNHNKLKAMRSKRSQIAMGE
jgi:hypothetical protein